VARLDVACALGALGALGLIGGAAAQDRMPWQASSGQEAPAVRYVYPEQVQIAAGKPSELELHFKVRDGLHINSHEPWQHSLIATDLVLIERPGLKVENVQFPPGSEYALKSMPNEKLSVYTGEVVLRARITATKGEHLLEGGLRYQACDTDQCYPPRQARMALDVVAR
jgi:hypothetical protein